MGDITSSDPHIFFTGSDCPLLEVNPFRGDSRNAGDVVTKPLSGTAVKVLN